MCGLSLLFEVVLLAEPDVFRGLSHASLLPLEPTPLSLLMLLCTLLTEDRLLESRLLESGLVALPRLSLERERGGLFLTHTLNLL